MRKPSATQIRRFHEACLRLAARRPADPTETLDHPKTALEYDLYHAESQLERLIERGAYADVREILERVSARLPRSLEAAE